MRREVEELIDEVIMFNGSKEEFEELSQRFTQTVHDPILSSEE